MKANASVRAAIVKAYLRCLATSSRPIVIGPWRSELGFEVLYWLPFLRWFAHTYQIDPARCIALSRGGMGALYPAGQAVDLFQLRSVEDVRLENGVQHEQTKMLKQFRVTAWDKAVAKDAAERVLGKGARYHLLHPSWMYWLFEPVWEEHATLRHIVQHCDFAPLPVPSLPDGLELPQQFVAVRFYERHTFPLQDVVVTIARELVQGLAQRFPVVLLNTPLFVDDHTDLPIVGPNIFTLPSVSPDQNLLLQAAVLARSQAFVGTYGGVAQWALRYRRPSLSFYTQFGGTAQAHRTLSHVLAAQMQTPFEVADLRLIKLYQAAMAPAVAAEPVRQPTGLSLTAVCSTHTAVEGERSTAVTPELQPDAVPA